MADEPDDGLAHLNNLDVTWGFDLDAFLQERAHQAPAAGDDGEGTAKTMDSSQWGAVDASSAPAGRAESETRSSSQGGAVYASSAPVERAESEMIGSPQGCAVEASSVPAGRAENDFSAASTKGTVTTPPRSCPRGQRTS